VAWIGQWKIAIQRRGFLRHGDESHRLTYSSCRPA
jgi:hypothetical protein